MAEDLDQQTSIGDSPPVTPDPPEALDEKDEKEIADKAAPDQRGERVVPLATLREERRAAREATKEAAALRQQVAELAKVQEQFQQYQQQVAPVLVQFAEQERQRREREAPPVSPEVQELQALGVSPDVAPKLASIIERTAQRIAGQMVQPLGMTVAQSAAEQLKAQLYAVQDKDGQPFASRQAIDQVMGAIMQTQPQLAASRDVGNLALYIARGMDPSRGIKTHEPTYSEAPGGFRPDSTGLTEGSRKMAEMVGMSPTEFAKLRNTDSLVLE